MQLKVTLSPRMHADPSFLPHGQDKWDTEELAQGTLSARRTHHRCQIQSVCTGPGR